MNFFYSFFRYYFLSDFSFFSIFYILKLFKIYQIVKESCQNIIIPIEIMCKRGYMITHHNRPFSISKEELD